MQDVTNVDSVKVSSSILAQIQSALKELSQVATIVSNENTAVMAGSYSYFLFRATGNEHQCARNAA